MKIHLLLVLLIIGVVSKADDFFPFESAEHLHEAMAEIAGQAGIPFPLVTQTMNRDEVESHALRRARIKVDREPFSFDERAFISNLEQELPILEVGESLSFLGLDNSQYRGDIRSFDDSTLILGGFTIATRHVPLEIRVRRSVAARNQYIQTRLRERRRIRHQQIENEIDRLQKIIATEFYKDSGYFLARDGKWYGKDQLEELLKKSAVNREYERRVTDGITKAREKIDQGETASAKKILQNLEQKYSGAPGISRVMELLSAL